jgi:hypothetical protein
MTRSVACGLWLVVGALGACLACSNAANGTSGQTTPDGGSSTPADPYAGFRSVTKGQVRCNGDSCCTIDCSYASGVTCMTRDPAVVAAWAAQDPKAAGCTGVEFPAWFYENDCFVRTEFNGITQAPYLSLDNATQKLWFGGTIVCVCGRTATQITSSWSSETSFLWNGCTGPMQDVASPNNGLTTCAGLCNSVCTPQCSGRTCGSDGCGGQCGTCPSGKTCTAAGQCAGGCSAGCQVGSVCCGGAFCGGNCVGTPCCG